MVQKRKATSHPDATKTQKTSASATDAQTFYTSALGLVMDLQDDSGVSLVEPFLKLPSKKLYPDYYEIISSPISLAEIGKKVKLKSYSLVEEFVQEFKLLLDNATKYNDPTSWIVTSATKMFEFVEEQVSQFNNKHHQKLKLKINPPPAETSGEIKFAKLPSLCIELLQRVLDHKFPGDGVISGPFIDDVDLELYPDYVNFVKHPTSFNNVINKIEKKRLFVQKSSIVDNLKKFHTATELIFSNAKLYNDPSSMIYQDAVKLNDYFNEQYQELLEKAEGKSTKLKLKLKQSKSKPSETSPKRSKVKQVTTEEIEEPVVKEEDIKPPVDVETDERTETKPVVTEKSVHNTLGKSSPTIPIVNCVIQESSISSTVSAAQLVTQQIQQRPFIHSDLADAKKELFPSHTVVNSTNLFEYKFPANGYANQSYSLPLPADASPFVTFKVELHNLLYNIKKHDLVDGHGYLNLTTDEDFQCKVYVNDEESLSNGDVYEEKDSTLLGIQYELKLSHGLNIIEFECKISPALTKKLKPSQEVEDSEIAGRHTRHQLQQLKMSWDVEKITFYVVLNNS
jgi:chromatin structure-remodeling complex subunit RSC4